MKTLSYNKLTKKQQLGFFDFLREINSEDPALDNMWHDDWSEKPNTLPHMLSLTSKFNGTSGDFHVVYDKKKIVGCGGIYRSSVNKHIALAGVRTWVNSEYRNRSLLKEYLLPFHKAWAQTTGCKQVALTFNDYNKNIIAIFKRRRLGESDRGHREEKHLFYSGLHEVKFPVVLQYTPQWVIYEKLDQAWEFNWRLLAQRS